MIQTFSGLSYQRHLDALAARDSRFRQIINRWGYPPLWSRPRGFAGLTRIILEQQVSLASAQSIWDRLESRVGSITPGAVLALTDQELAGLGLTRQKRGYIRRLARTLLDPDSRLDLDRLDTLPDQEVRRRLTAIKGIGPWTADIYLIMALHRRDIFPSGDLALNKTRAALDLLSGQSPARPPIHFEPADFAPYRSLLACLLWHWYIRTGGALGL